MLWNKKPPTISNHKYNKKIPDVKNVFRDHHIQHNITNYKNNGLLTCSKSLHFLSSQWVISFIYSHNGETTIASNLKKVGVSIRLVEQYIDDLLKLEHSLKPWN